MGKIKEIFKAMWVLKFLIKKRVHTSKYNDAQLSATDNDGKLRTDRHFVEKYEYENIDFKISGVKMHWIMFIWVNDDFMIEMI